MLRCLYRTRVCFQKPATASTATDTTNTNAETSIETVPKAQFEELDKKYAQMTKAYQEAKIEQKAMENRFQKEKESIKQFGAQKFAKDLFVVYDTLVNASRYNQDNGKDGFEMIRKQIIKTFKDNKLELIDPVEGELFNHDVHEALYQMPHKEYKEGMIGKVEQAGFQLNGRVLRAAQVGVVKK